MPDLSIIIPVYNTPVDALERCFASVKALPVSYEVLIVDDGSQAPTDAFCREYAENNPGFVCFTMANGGVSAARNYGLSQAQGQYIVFLDSDDELLPQVFTPELLSTDQDLIILDTTLVENGQESQWYAFDREEGPLTKEELLAQLIASKSLNGPYAKLLKRQIIADHHIRFNTDFVTGEDWDFVCSFALQTATATYCKVPSYVYYRDEGNSKSRINRFPDVVLKNLTAMFRRKEGLAQKLPEGKALLSTAGVFLIEDLFNSAADLHLLKKLTGARKAYIVHNCRCAWHHLAGNPPFKTRMKAWILLGCFPLVYPLARLREVYLSRR